MLPRAWSEAASPVGRYGAAVNAARSRSVAPLIASGPVTSPRNDTHYVATEFGVVNLKALSTTERAGALIGLAHPDYRGWLTDNAQRMHLI